MYILDITAIEFVEIEPLKMISFLSVLSNENKEIRCPGILLYFNERSLKMPLKKGVFMLQCKSPYLSSKIVFP